MERASRWGLGSRQRGGEAEAAKRRPEWLRLGKPRPAQQKPANDEVGPQIEAAPSVKAKPEAQEAELKAGLPAVIPVTKPLADERVSRWNDAMTAMNEQHAVIENVGNKTVIASWEPSPTNLNRRALVFQGKDSFLLRYSNRVVQIELSDGK